MNLHQKSTNLKIPGVSKEGFFPLSLCLEQMGSKAVRLRPLALWGTSLCCVNGCWAFIWQYLTHGRRCCRMSHSSSKYRLNGISSLASSNLEGAAQAWLFIFLLRLNWRYHLFGCLPAFFPVFFPRLLFLVIHEKSNLKSSLKLSSRWI